MPRDVRSLDFISQSVGFHPAMTSPASTYPAQKPSDSTLVPEICISEHFALTTTGYTVDRPSFLARYAEMSGTNSQDFERENIDWPTPDVVTLKCEQLVPQQQDTQYIPSNIISTQHLTRPDKSLDFSFNYQQDRPHTIHSPAPIASFRVPSYAFNSQLQTQSPPPQRHTHSALPDVDDWRSPAPASSDNIQYSTSSTFLSQADVFDFPAQPHFQSQLQQHPHHFQSQHPTTYCAHGAPFIVQQSFGMTMLDAHSSASKQYDEHGGSTAVYTLASHSTSDQGYVPRPDAGVHPLNAGSGYADMYDLRLTSGSGGAAEGEWGSGEAVLNETGCIWGMDVDAGPNGAGEDHLGRHAAPHLHQQQEPQCRTALDDKGEEYCGNEKNANDGRAQQCVLTADTQYVKRHGRSMRYSPHPLLPCAFGFAGVQGQHPGTPQASLQTSTSPPGPEIKPTTAARVRRPYKLPAPVPVPNLTKRARGRRVPIAEVFKDVIGQKATEKAAVGEVEPRKDTRTYKCPAEGCRKLFVRGGHLRRHVRSVHTYVVSSPLPS